MQGEEGKLKFIKITYKNSPKSPSDQTDKIEVSMEIMEIDKINDCVDKKMCNCVKIFLECPDISVLDPHTEAFPIAMEIFTS